MTKYITRPDVVACEIDEGQALLNLKTSQYFKLNSSGALVWECLEMESSVEQMLDRMCEVFEVSREECRPDIVHLLSALEEAGLVERTS